MPIPLGILAVAGAGAAGAGAFDLLETTVLSSAASSVTFSSLGSYSAYKHLQIRAVYSNDSATQAGTLLRLNSDSGSNYAAHNLRGNGSSVTSSASTAQTSIFLTSSPPNGNPETAEIVDILDFGSSAKNTTVRSLGGLLDPVAPSTNVFLRSGLWINTSAVTAIAIICNGASFAIGSRFSLYGIK